MMGKELEDISGCKICCSCNYIAPADLTLYIKRLYCHVYYKAAYRSTRRRLLLSDVLTNDQEKILLSGQPYFFRRGSSSGLGPEVGLPFPGLGPGDIRGWAQGMLD